MLPDHGRGLLLREAPPARDGGPRGDPRPLRPVRPDDHVDHPLRARGAAALCRSNSALFSRAKGGDAIATKEEKLELEGEVVEAFPNGMFKVTLDTGPGGARLHGRQDAPLPHQDLPGRPRQGRGLPVRPDARPDRLPVPLGEQAPEPLEAGLEPLVGRRERDARPAGAARRRTPRRARRRPASPARIRSGVRPSGRRHQT